MAQHRIKRGQQVLDSDYSDFARQTRLTPETTLRGRLVSVETNPTVR